MDGEDSLRDEEKVPRIWIFSEQKLFVKLGIFGAHQLVKDVVIPLDSELKRNAGLFEKVSFDVGRGDLVGRTEVDADELTLLRKRIFTKRT